MKIDVGIVRPCLPTWGSPGTNWAWAQPPGPAWLWVAPAPRQAHPIRRKEESRVVVNGRWLGNNEREVKFLGGKKR